MKQFLISKFEKELVVIRIFKGDHEARNISEKDALHIRFPAPNKNLWVINAKKTNRLPLYGKAVSLFKTQRLKASINFNRGFLF